MNPERWEKITEIYHSALELEADDRKVFLDKVCAEDESLRREVESLLEADARANGFISEHAVKEVASLFSEKKQTLIGRSLGHYEIVAQLGSGGMGEVYLAKDLKLHRSVAVKALPPSFSGSQTYLRRFQTEAKAAATLNHPNVATIYSVEETNGHRFITMEYVEGKTLDSVIPAAGLDIKTFLEWFIVVADALAHAHQKGIIHRDIKPGNIMITPDGIPKILDFGLARIDRAKEANEESTLSMTQPGQIFGTPNYMSPEQAEGRQIDPRTDIFSLGVVMYEAITGKRPFKGESYASRVSQLLTREPPPIVEIKPETPFLLSHLIMRCLNKDPRYRYQSMNEVRVILEEIKAAVEAEKSGTNFVGVRSLKAKSFSRRGLAGLGVLLLILGGVLFWIFLKYNRTEPKPVTGFVINHPHGKEMSLAEVRISRDGRNIIFNSSDNDVKQLYLRPLDKFQPQPIAGTEGAGHPFFSYDGNWIGFFVDENKLKKVPVSGGTPFTICDSCKSAFESDWGADDTIIASDSEGLYRIGADGGSPERLTKIDQEKGEKSHRAPQILPDGKNVLFTIETGTSTRYAVISLTTKALKYLPGIEETQLTHGETSFAQYISTGHLIYSRGKQLLAIPFDPGRLEISGSAFPVLEGVFPTPGFRVTDNGTLMFLPEAANNENILVWVDRQGQTIPVMEKKADYRSPRIAPDGRRFAVQIDKDIWVYELATGRGLRLTFEGENQVPLWTPDSKSVVYATKSGSSWTIYKKSADGTGETEKLFTSETRHLPYSWHPAENVLTMTVLTTTGNSDLVALSTPDGKVSTFLSTPYKEDTPRFSPDGRWLTYFSMESEKVQVYVQPWAAEGGKVPVSRDGGMFPVWSPKGDELFYRRGNKLYAVEINTAGREFSAGQPRILFEGSYLTSYDVAPDGSRFLMVKNEGGSMPRQVNIVLNWTEELKKYVQTGK